MKPVVQRFLGKVAFAPGGTNLPLGGGGAALTASTRISAEALQSLATTPVLLVPSPGAGKIIQIIAASAQYFGGAAAVGNDIFEALFLASAVGSPLFYTVSNPLALLNEFSSFAPYGSTNYMADIVDHPIVVTTQSDLGIVGPISSLSVSGSEGAGGSGYAVGDTGEIAESTNDAFYTVTAVDGADAVTALALSSPGTGYRTSSGVPTINGGSQPGSGSGLTVNLTADTSATGAVQVDMVYNIIQAAA